MIPTQGEYWINKKEGHIVYICGTDPDGNIVYMTKNQDGPTFHCDTVANFMNHHYYSNNTKEFKIEQYPQYQISHDPQYAFVQIVLPTEVYNVKLNGTKIRMSAKWKPEGPTITYEQAMDRLHWIQITDPNHQWRPNTDWIKINDQNWKLVTTEKMSDYPVNFTIKVRCPEAYDPKRTTEATQPTKLKHSYEQIRLISNSPTTIQIIPYNSPYPDQGEIVIQNEKFYIKRAQ